MKSFGDSVRRTILSLLFTTGVTLLFFLCMYGISHFFNAMNASADPGLLGFLCAILVLLFYPLTIAFGAGAVIVAGLIAKQDLRFKWLPMFALGAAVFCFGHLIFTQNDSLLGIPQFLRPIIDTLASIREGSGAYCMLYGGSMMLMLIYTGMRVSFLTAIPKLLLQIGGLIIPLALCIQVNFNVHDIGLLSLLTYPAMIFGLVLCAVLGGFLPYNFAHNVGGHMRPFFWLMYLLSVLFGLLGLSLILGTTLMPNFLYDLVNSHMPFIPWEVTNMLEELNGLLMGIGLFAMGVLWLICTFDAKHKRCSSCGLYAYEKVEDLGTVGSYVSDRFKSISSTLTKTHIYAYGFHRDFYSDHEDDHETVSYTGEESVHCRYCGRSYGTRTYSGSYDNIVDSRKVGEHSEFHYW